MQRASLWAKDEADAQIPRVETPTAQGQHPTRTHGPWFYMENVKI